MDTIDTICQKCRRRIRIVKGRPALCRRCAGSNQEKTVKGQYFHKGTRIIAPGRKKNERRKKWWFW